MRPATPSRHAAPTPLRSAAQILTILKINGHQNLGIRTSAAEARAACEVTSIVTQRTDRIDDNGTS